jgi:hypothetical protein
MCAYSQYNILVDRLQPIAEINEAEVEGYDDMPELIDDNDLPDLEPVTPIPRPEDDENDEQPEENEPHQPQEEEEQLHQELVERLYFNLRGLYNDLL